MGKYSKGILGGFTGKVGTIIGGRWKGIQYMRSLPEMSNKNPTERQIINRARFAFASKFLQPLQPVIKIGFRTYAKHQSPQNAAMSDFMTNALIGEYPDFRVNYEALRIAKGSLMVANSYQVELDNNSIVFSWSDQSQLAADMSENRALMVALGENINPVYSISEYTRGQQSGAISLPSAPSGSIVYCYLAFTHESNFSEVCNSKLAGSITIP